MQNMTIMRHRALPFEVANLLSLSGGEGYEASAGCCCFTKGGPLKGNITLRVLLVSVNTL